jgi:hypothetical protein
VDVTTPLRRVTWPFAGPSVISACPLPAAPPNPAGAQTEGVRRVPAASESRPEGASGASTGSEDGRVDPRLRPELGHLGQFRRGGGG